MAKLVVLPHDWRLFALFQLDDICILICHALTCSYLQGYLSFWNDSISYALRGCILIELALRRRIALVKDSGQRRSPLADRLVEVIDDKQTGETILDEALKMMKGQESDRMSISGWVDLLSGASRITDPFCVIYYSRIDGTYCDADFLHRGDVECHENWIPT